MRNKEKAEQEVEDKRRVHLMKQVKWEEFRKRKHAIVIRYARVKKRQWRNIVWLQMMMKSKCLKKAYWNINATREYRSWSV
jgi:ATP-dependent Clp protease ATP-binding subunit ClpA